MTTTAIRQKRGPLPMSEGARRIAEAHRGPHEHDLRGGFGANPQLAKEVGRKGGTETSRIYGPQFYREIGKKGGDTILRERGPEWYAKIGSRGRKARAERQRAETEREEASK